VIDHVLLAVSRFHRKEQSCSADPMSI